MISLTQKDLEKYKGGQVEVEWYGGTNCGPIDEISIDGKGMLTVGSPWSARFEADGRWINDGAFNLNLKFNTSAVVGVSVSDLGDGRLRINFFGEAATLFPNTHPQRLEASQVEGLNLNA